MLGNASRRTVGASTPRTRYDHRAARRRSMAKKADARAKLKTEAESIMACPSIRQCRAQSELGVRARAEEGQQLVVSFGIWEEPLTIIQGSLGLAHAIASGVDIGQPLACNAQVRHHFQGVAETLLGFGKVLGAGGAPAQRHLAPRRIRRWQQWARTRHIRTDQQDRRAVGVQRTPLAGVAQGVHLLALVSGPEEVLGARAIDDVLPTFLHTEHARVTAIGFVVEHSIVTPVNVDLETALATQVHVAAPWVERKDLSGKVFSFYPWGGYVDLRSQGRLKVYIDGRDDTVFDDETYRRYSRVLGVEEGWQDIVDGSGAEYFLWPRHQRKQVDTLRDSGKWRALYADRTAVLLIRSDMPRPGPLLPSPDSPWREVALGWRAASAKNFAEAEKRFRHALEMMPNLRIACEWLANIYARSDRMGQAEATLNDCQRLFPDPERYDELLTFFRTRADTEL